jgi:6-phosphogluconate dehydrogenase
MIAAAVHARFLYSDLDQRKRTVSAYQSTAHEPSTPADEQMLASAFHTARIVNHHLGFELLKAASYTYAWQLDLKEIARIWTNGCIIRSSLMEDLHTLLPDSILLHPTMIDLIRDTHEALSKVVMACASLSQYAPCHSAALNHLNALTRDQPIANLIQAQRDMFGAHGFQRRDDESGKVYHL